MMNQHLMYLVVWVFLLTACTTPPVTVTEPDPLPAAAEDDEYWWYVRFRQPWPEGDDPAWYKDVLLADQVVAPVLTKFGAAISLWRIHRRAARTPAGHQFSLIVRTTPATAARINARIAADPLVIDRLRRNTLEAVRYDDPAQPQRPAIEDTSDRNWTPEMQRAWPYFIMGVSRLWLELIAELAVDAEAAADLDTRYAAISADLDNLWLHQGGHALLHHLSAVFGYREVNVVRRERMRF
jgi:hypothetical protein